MGQLVISDIRESVGTEDEHRQVPCIAWGCLDFLPNYWFNKTDFVVHAPGHSIIEKFYANFLAVASIVFVSLSRKKVLVSWAFQVLLQSRDTVLNICCHYDIALNTLRILEPLCSKDIKKKFTYDTEQDMSQIFGLYFSEVIQRHERFCSP